MKRLKKTIKKYKSVEINLYKKTLINIDRFLVAKSSVLKGKLFLGIETEVIFVLLVTNSIIYYW